MKRILTLIVVICMVTTLFAACTKPAEKEATPTTTKATQTVPTTTEDPKAAYLNEKGAFASEDVVLPITKEPVKLSFCTVQAGNNGPAEDYWFWKWMEKFGNIKADVNQIPAATWGEQKQLIFATDDLPDLFLMCNFSTSEIVKFGMIEKQLMPMNELTEKYAPNFKAACQKYSTVIPSITLPDGNFYSLPEIAYDFGAKFGHRTYINTRWIEEAGLKEPDTLDDLYNVLRAFKARGEDIIPFSGSWYGGYREDIYVLAALGMNSNGIYSLDEKDGKVYAPFYDARYLEYLKFFNNLWREGLMDPDIFTQNTKQQDTKSKTGKVGMTNGSTTWNLFGDNWADYEALRPLTSEFNDTRMYPTEGVVQYIDRIILSKDCKYPEAAIRFADMFFTQQSTYLLAWGPFIGYDPEEWFLGEPEKYATNLLTSDTGAIVHDIGMMKETGLKYWAYVCKFINPINGRKPGLQQGDVNYFYKRVNKPPIVYSKTDKVYHAFASLNEKVIPYQKEIFPPLILTEEANTRVSELAGQFNDYVREMEIKFITGEEPLENFDNYMKQVKDFGIEEYLQIYQDAYDFYLKNMKK